MAMAQPVNQGSRKQRSRHQPNLGRLRTPCLATKRIDPAGREQMSWQPSQLTSPDEEMHASWELSDVGRILIRDEPNGRSPLSRHEGETASSAADAYVPGSVESLG